MGRWTTMAKRKRQETAEDRAFDERTTMINDSIASLRERIAARKAAQQQADRQTG